MSNNCPFCLDQKSNSQSEKAIPITTTQPLCLVILINKDHLRNIQVRLHKFLPSVFKETVVASSYVYKSRANVPFTDALGNQHEQQTHEIWRQKLYICILYLKRTNDIDNNYVKTLTIIYYSVIIG